MIFKESHFFFSSIFARSIAKHRQKNDVKPKCPCFPPKTLKCRSGGIHFGFKNGLALTRERPKIQKIIEKHSFFTLPFWEHFLMTRYVAFLRSCPKMAKSVQQKFVQNGYPLLSIGRLEGEVDESSLTRPVPSLRGGRILTGQKLGLQSSVRDDVRSV